MQTVPTIVAALVPLLIACGSASGPDRLTLGARGGALTVNGAPRFLVLVSYFDALDASALDRDLRYIAEGADGIRVFANWWDADRRRPCTAFSDRTVMRVGSDGRVSLRPERLDRLKAVLRAARSHGLVVDLTFSYETVLGLSKLTPGPDGRLCGSSGEITNAVRLEEYARGLAEAARALAAPEFDHVFFDLQNEFSGGWTRLSHEEVRTLARAVRTADPSRLLSASDFNPDPARHIALAREAGLDLVNFHDFPRDDRWPERTGQLVSAFSTALTRAGLTIPVYAGEPPPESRGRGPNAFGTSLAGARAAGAAAWTFHTRAAFRLDEQDFASQLDKDQRAFFDDLRARKSASGSPPPARR
jgi:hypothetical protein